MKEKLDRIRQHLNKYKVVYITGGVCLVVGAVAGVTLSKNVQVTAIQIAGKDNTIIQETITILARRGHPGNIVRCKETGEVFASQNRAADILGINRGNLSSHLSGKFESANGLHFERLGEATA